MIRPPIQINRLFSLVFCLLNVHIHTIVGGKFIQLISLCISIVIYCDFIHLRNTAAYGSFRWLYNAGNARTLEMLSTPNWAFSSEKRSTFRVSVVIDLCQIGAEHRSTISRLWLRKVKNHAEVISIVWITSSRHDSVATSFERHIFMAH